MLSLALRCEQSMLVDDEEPSRYVKTISGTIKVLGDDGDGETDAGTFRVFIVDAESAINDHEPVFDVFDTFSATAAYFELYTPNMDFKPKVVRALGGDDRWGPGMLILDRLEILPAYRGQAIGLRVLRWLCLQFSMGCGIIAMKPFPLQFEGGVPAKNKQKDSFQTLRLDTFSSNLSVATKKLRRYYGRLGFVSVPRTPFMVADPMRPTPTFYGLLDADQETSVASPLLT